MWRVVIDSAAGRRRNLAVVSGALLLTFLLSLHVCALGGDTAAALFENGDLDLTSCDLAVNGPVRLDGLWQFCWGRLLEPGAPEWMAHDSTTEFQAVPRFWTAYKGHDYPSDGRGTYRLRIRTTGQYRNLALRTPEIFSEYRLWVNGHLIDQNGVLPDADIGFLRPGAFVFASASPEVEIVLQVQNHLHANAGIGQSFFLGTEQQIYRNYIVSISFEVMLISICVFAGVYHMVIFASRRQEKELLFFGLFCFMLALRTFFTGHTLASCLFPGLSFVLGSKLSTATVSLSAILFNVFFCDFFRSVIHEKLFKFLNLTHVLYLLLVIILPPAIYTKIFAWYLGLIAIHLVLVVWANIKGLMHRVPFSGWFFSGLAVLAVGVVNDMFHYLQLINSGYYLALFFQAFILIQSIMLATKFSREHQTVARLTDKLQVLDKLKDEFLANTSHELRTPLNGIIGLAESLTDGVAGDLPGRARDNLALIIASGRRLSHLINDILDFSKLRNNDIVIAKKWVDVRPVATAVIAVIQSTTVKKDVRLINDIPEDAPLVKADENRLQQIFFNLIGNSVKFTDAGYVRIFLQLDGDVMTVCVEDTGPGIPSDKMEVIFRPFEQGDGSEQRGYAGTGLGLPITKKLVELHGGRMQVNSTPGQGTCFSFTLPGIKKQEEPHEQGETAEGPPEVFNPEEKSATSDITKRDATPGKRIFIVDDEAVNVQVLLDYLELKGYDADCAASGCEALEKMETEKYDLILLDIMMPRMSGYEVCREVRKKHSASELPVIFLSAGNQPQDMTAAFAAGASDYLFKPVDKTELFARIETHLALKDAEKRAISNARLARIDPLTGLFNRRFLEDTGQREFKRARRGNGEMAVIMLDIDHFKGVNDTYGHDAGDVLIKQVADIILTHIRETDFPARYGGDEFVMILPETGLKGAAFVAEKVRAIAEQSVVKAPDGRELSFTLSLGAAAFYAGLGSFDDVVKMADEKLYESKKNGRNRLTY